MPEVRETDRAEADLLAVSFQSVTYPERHVWVHTYNQGHKIIIDLEDWNTNVEWDHSTAHKATSSVTEAVEIIESWLSGKDPQ
jgi:hypothetical protein